MFFFNHFQHYREISAARGDQSNLFKTQYINEIDDESSPREVLQKIS